MISTAHPYNFVWTTLLLILCADQVTVRRLSSAIFYFSSSVGSTRMQVIKMCYLCVIHRQVESKQWHKLYLSDQSLSLLITILERLQRKRKAKFVTKLTNNGVVCIYRTLLVLFPVLLRPITKQPKPQNPGTKENGDKLVWNHIFSCTDSYMYMYMNIYDINTLQIWHRLVVRMIWPTAGLMTLKDTIALGLIGSDITDRDTTGTDMTKTDMIYRGQYSGFSDIHVRWSFNQNLIRF